MPEKEDFNIFGPCDFLQEERERLDGLCIGEDIGDMKYLCKASRDVIDDISSCDMGKLVEDVRAYSEMKVEAERDLREMSIFDRKESVIFLREIDSVFDRLIEHAGDHCICNTR